MRARVGQLGGSGTIPDATKLAFYADAADARHGTTNGYCNLACRCQPCRDAWKTRCLRRRTERAAALDTSGVTHGTQSTYTNHKCRCEDCTAAHRVARRRSA